MENRRIEALASLEQLKTVLPIRNYANMLRLLSFRCHHRLALLKRQSPKSTQVR
jgi:hypothetical protein